MTQRGCIKWVLLCGAAVASLGGAQAAWGTTFDLAAQPAQPGILSFAQQAGLQIFAPAAVVRDRWINEVRGDIDPRAALNTLIAGTGLTVVRDKGGVITLGIKQRTHYAAASQEESRTANQAPAAGEAQSAGTLQEILVTAQRRSENLQNVPISISTLSANRMSNVGVLSSDALTAVAPGLIVTRRAFGAVPYLRGVGSQNVAAGSESSIALYVDGVYYMNPLANIFSFNNIDRVEVLKGPQGTLFGRNASGGAINVTTRDPQPGTTFEGNVSYGNYGIFEGAGYASHGNDTVGADLAVYTIQQSDGFGKYTLTGRDANRQRETAVRGKLLFHATDANRLVLSADWSTNKGDLGATRNALPGAILIGGFRFSGNPYDSQANLETKRLGDDYWGASARYEHQFSWGTFSSLSATRKLHSDYVYDQDATPLAAADIHIVEDEQTFQQEFLLVGTASRLDWTTGVFIFHATSKYDPLAIGSTLARSSNVMTYTRQKTDSYAGFAQATYAITDATKVTAGARYTVDRRDFRGQTVAATGNARPAGTLLASRASAARFPKVTWRFAVDHKLADSLLVYGSFSRGFKSGEYNLASSTSPFVRPETLDALEVGVKSEWLDHTVRLNASVFHYDYKDIQLYSVQVGASTLLNAAQGRINGADAELTIAPRIAFGDLQVTSGLSILDTKYNHFPSGVLTARNPAGGDTQILTDLSGNTMAVAPKWTFQVGIDYSIPLGTRELRLSGNYFHNDGFFWDYGNRLQQPAYDVVNAQVAYSFGENERFRVRAFAKNLFDERYYIYVQEGSLGDLASAALPRAYGVGMDVKL